MDRLARSRIIANGIRKSSTEVLIPFATLYLSSLYGAARTGVIIFTILALGAVFNLLSGRMLSGLSLRRIIVWSELFNILTLTGMCLTVACHQHVLFVLLYILKSILFSLSIPASEAVLALSSKQTRRRTYTLNFWAVSVIAPFFSIIGAFVYDVSFIYVISISVLLSCLYTALSFVSIPEHLLLDSKASSTLCEEVFKNRDFYRFMTVWLACVLMVSIMFLFNTYFAIGIATHHYALPGFSDFSGVRFFGSIKYLSALLPLLALPMLGKSLDAIQEKLNITYAYTVLLLLYLLLYSGVLYDSWSQVALLALLISAVGMVIEPMRSAMVIDLIDGKSHPSLYYSLSSLIGRAGNILASLMLACSGKYTFFMLLAGGAACSGVTLLWFGMKINRTSLHARHIHA